MQAKANVLKNTKLKINVSNKTYRTILVSVFSGLVLLAFVMLSAYAASLQHENNMLQKENDYIQAEIDILNNEIVEETKLSNVEKTATEKLGMVYADENNIIEIQDTEKSQNSNLASLIKEEAYK